MRSSGSKSNTPNIWQTDTVQKAISAAAAMDGQFKTERFIEFANKCGPGLSRSESPIEAVFWLWWTMLSDHVSMPDLIAQYSAVVYEAAYRLDFAVFPQRIAIELDGHDFHERTKEQVEYRNRRDRDLQRDGWQIMHFSGSEILRDPASVVRDVVVRAREIDAADRARIEHEPKPEPQLEAAQIRTLKTNQPAWVATWLAKIQAARKFFYGTVMAQAFAIDVQDDALSIVFRHNHESLAKQVEPLREWLETLATEAAGTDVRIRACLTTATELTTHG